MEARNKRSLTGIRPSGETHIGNYLGMIKPALELQRDYECFYFLADLHALTTNKDPGELQRQVLDIVAIWLSLGFDPKANILYRQSDVPLVTELAWYLSTVTGMGLLEKGHAYKDATAQNKEVNHAVFAYPVLMAADILICDADVVPVGKDQKQHVEMARDMAGSFNAVYGDVLHLPQVLLREEVMVIPGLDGRKMSKSYGNVIPLFCPAKELRKKVMSLKTDSTPLEEPKSMQGSLLGHLFSLFAGKEQYADLEGRLNKGGLGWGHAKEELYQVMNAELEAPRERYLALRRNEAELEAVLDGGARRMFDVALPVLERMRKAAGMRKFPYRLGS